jgi:hypothetical protein
MALHNGGPVIGAASAEPIIAGTLGPAFSVTEEPGIPAGFPRTLTSDLSWTGSQFTRESQYVYRIDEVEHDEIAKALVAFKCMKLSIPITLLPACLPHLTADRSTPVCLLTFFPPSAVLLLACLFLLPSCPTYTIISALLSFLSNSPGPTSLVFIPLLLSSISLYSTF